MLIRGYDRINTSKGYDEEFGIYSLGFPNREVEEGFIRCLLPFCINKVEAPFETFQYVCVTELTQLKTLCSAK